MVGRWTQVLDRSWQGSKVFLPKHMRMKCNDKGHSKMHLNILSAYTCGLGDKVLEHPSQRTFLRNWKNCSDQKKRVKMMLGKTSCLKSENRENKFPLCGKTTYFAISACHNRFQNPKTSLHVKTRVTAHLTHEMHWILQNSTAVYAPLSWFNPSVCCPKWKCTITNFKFGGLPKIDHGNGTGCFFF